VGAVRGSNFFRRQQTLFTALVWV